MRIIVVLVVSPFAASDVVEARHLEDVATAATPYNHNNDLVGQLGEERLNAGEVRCVDSANSSIILEQAEPRLGKDPVSSCSGSVSTDTSSIPCCSATYCNTSGRLT